MSGLTVACLLAIHKERGSQKCYKSILMRDIHPLPGMDRYEAPATSCGLSPFYLSV
jgi:hypothetical protein